MLVLDLGCCGTLLDDYTQDGTVDFRGKPAVPSKTGKWKTCAFLVGYEAFERMAFYGIASNLVNYLTAQLHEDTVSSVRNVNNWSGSVWITPILGAYIADSHLGRFWTFTLSSLIYVLSLKPTCTNGVCNKASTSQVALFCTALYTMAIGAGGTKPNISTFGADQFDHFNPREKELKVSFFNWWMFTSFLGALIATLGLVYIQENLGWGLGYGIPTAGLLLSLVIFYIGMPIYRHKVRTTKSPARDIIRVLIAAFQNRKLQLPSDPSDLNEYEMEYNVGRGKRQVYHTPTLRFQPPMHESNTLYRGRSFDDSEPYMSKQTAKARAPDNAVKSLPADKEKSSSVAKIKVVLLGCHGPLANHQPGRAFINASCNEESSL